MIKEPPNAFCTNTQWSSVHVLLCRSNLNQAVQLCGQKWPGLSWWSNLCTLQTTNHWSTNEHIIVAEVSPMLALSEVSIMPFQFLSLGNYFEHTQLIWSKARKHNQLQTNRKTNHQGQDILSWKPGRKRWREKTTTNLARIPSGLRALSSFVSHDLIKKVNVHLFHSPFVSIYFFVFVNFCSCNAILSAAQHESNSSQKKVLILLGSPKPTQNNQFFTMF